MTYQEAYQKATGELKAAGIPEPESDAWILLEHVTGMTRTRYYVDGFERMPKNEEDRFFELVSCRKTRIPVQHLTGVQEFMGYEFAVNEHVLVPRQDTEILVEEAEKRLLLMKKENPVKVLDMCTGSGCVLISILKNVHGTGGYGYDISKQAINVAKENAKLNDVPAIFERSNLFEDVADETFDVIVSNPPYIRSDEIPFLMPEVSEFEPHEALDGKEDGLFFYRKIIQESPDYLTDGGYLLFEIGYDQGWAVSSMMKEAGFEDVCVKKDLARNDRVVCGHKHLCEKRG